MSEQPLLTITPAALKKIESVRKSAGNPKGLLRIGIKSHRGPMFEYELALVNPEGQEPDDVAIDYPELRVLVAPKSVELLRGTTVDVDATGESIGPVIAHGGALVIPPAKVVPTRPLMPSAGPVLVQVTVPIVGMAFVPRTA